MDFLILDNGFLMLGHILVLALPKLFVFGFQFESTLAFNLVVCI